MIVTRFEKKISLSGLAHCFDLIGSGAPGYDKDFHGFEPRLVCSLLWKYLKEQREAILLHRTEAAKVPKSTEAVNVAGRDETLKRIKELSARLDEKQKSNVLPLSLNDRRGYKYKHLGDFCPVFKLNEEKVKEVLAERWKAAYKAKGVSMPIEVYLMLENQMLIEEVNKSEERAKEIAEGLRKLLLV